MASNNDILNFYVGQVKQKLTKMIKHSSVSNFRTVSVSLDMPPSIFNEHVFQFADYKTSS